jgi:hypothetical protein
VDRRAEEVSCRAGQGSEGHAGKSVVIPGLYQDESVRAGAGHQQRAGQRGQDGYGCAGADESAASDQIADFKALVADLNAGKVDWLVILNANPIYNAPADLEFARRLRQGQDVAHLGSHVDETGQIAHWHIPAAHLSGVVVGCAGLRRHGFDRAADDRSALWRQDGASCFQALLMSRC